MPAALPSPLPTETVSISAVAAHAGVSVATVSRVMNEQAGVRAPTRDKVLASV
ncbi:LacI family DNA-binding transcriptional regulator [Janthinobacterium sp. Ant5-2-1]